MQLYVVTWKFETSEYQSFAGQALLEHLEDGKGNDCPPGYERLAWIHTPQDGTGTVICKAESASVLYKVFNPWREKYGMTWTYTPGLSTEDLIELIKENK